jgi:hypothetical protein
MIRIYTDRPGCIGLVVRDRAVEIYPRAARPAAPEAFRPQARSRRIGLVTAALLVVASGVTGYVIAQRSSSPHATGVAAAAYRPSYERPALRLAQDPPAPGPQAVIDALSSTPSVTPPPPLAKPATPPGVAAFGLQP